MPTCAICLLELASAKAIVPCCFQEVCTTCLMNCVALNCGDETATTRNKCPFCREQICEAVAPDTKFTAVLDNYKDTLRTEIKTTHQLINQRRILRRDVTRLRRSLTDETKYGEEQKRRSDELQRTLSRKIMELDNIHRLCNCVVSDWEDLSSNCKVDSDADSVDVGINYGRRWPVAARGRFSEEFARIWSCDDLFDDVEELD